jgi:predicted Zn-dependent protease
VLLKKLLVPAMLTPQQSYLLAAIVVGFGLTVLGFFVREGIATSNTYRQGVTLYQQRDYKGAEAAFRQVISRHPSNDIVHLLLGDVLMQLDLPEEAIAQFREVIRLSPKNVDAHLRLGNVLIKLGSLEEAIAALKTARDLYKAQGNSHKADQIEQLLSQSLTGIDTQQPSPPQIQ